MLITVFRFVNDSHPLGPTSRPKAKQPPDRRLSPGDLQRKLQNAQTQQKRSGQEP